MEGLSAICAGFVTVEEDDDGNRIGYSKDEYCLDNLKDLLRFLRRDDPQTREVFKLVCKWNIVGKDLLPIIEHFQNDRNLVLNAVKVLVFLTMPIEPTTSDIPQQIDYLWDLKSSITCSDTLTVIVSLLENPLENLEREAFTEEDWKLVQLVFTLFRNLLAIQDISPHHKAGGSATQFLSLRDKFLEQLFHENVMDLILVLTQHVGGSCKYLRHDNLLLLEILHYIFMDQEPELIAKANLKDLKVNGDAKTNSLRSMMEEEKRKLAKLHKKSAFAQLSGTFTRLTMDGKNALFKGNPCSSPCEALLKSHQVHRGPLKKVACDHGNLPSSEDKILKLLHDFVNQLLSGGYNDLMQSIRNDIEKEHHKIQNSDIIIFFQVARFITSFQNHKFSCLKNTAEADPFEATANYQTDSTLFKGSICGPIAATMNESMFLLVISKWRYAYDGLKETKEYNFVSAAGSLMKIMIRMLDTVLKVSPEDSKEPQTARVLLYKLFYDQTDEGMTQFLLNQIKAFDNHKQAKSDLVDLVEIIYVVIRLMEDLQERGTLRVSKKSRTKRAKRKSNDKKDKIEKPIEDNVPIENGIGSLGSEPPSDTTVLSEELLSTSADEKDATALPCSTDKPVPLESEAPNNESNQMGETKEPPCEDNDDIFNESGDASSDDQLASTNEVDFKVSSLVSALANKAVIKHLCWLLKFYRNNSVRTNHYIISLLRRICDDLELSPMLYQLSYLTTFYMILNEQKSSPSKEYENIVTFLSTLVRRMMRKMKNQPLLFVELLFPKTRKECHYINCEALVHEVGELKGDTKKYASVSQDGEIGSTQGKGWVRRSLADALGDDEADFAHSYEKDENPYNVKIHEDIYGQEGENATSIANDGIHSNVNYDSERNLEPGPEGLPKRRKKIVLDENLESKIKDLYEKYKNDRYCSRLIAEALDSTVKVSPAQLSSKLRQLGLRVWPKKRTLEDETPDHPGEEGTSTNESNLPFENESKESSAFRPLHTKKRVRAFNEAQEMAIKNLYEQFKDHKNCNHMIANALDADGKFTAAQVSRKLKQLGLHIPKRKRSGSNMQLMDEDPTNHVIESAEDTDGETLLSLRKRSKNKNIEKDAQEVENKESEGKTSEDYSDNETLISVFGSKNKKIEKDTREVENKESEGKSSEDNSDNETLISVFGSKNKNIEKDTQEVENKQSEGKSLEDNSDNENLISVFGKKTRRGRKCGSEGDTPDVAKRDTKQSTEIKNLEDGTANEVSTINSEKQREAMIIDDADHLPHQHLMDHISNSGDGAISVASQTDAILRRKLRMVIDLEDDD